MATGTRRVTDKYKWISAGGGALEIGTSSVPLNVKTASDPLVQLYTTSPLTTGSIRTHEISYVQTGIMATGDVQALRVGITSEVKTGAWANAITAYLNYGTEGAAHGEAGPLYAELTVPNSSLERGELYGLGVGIGVGASSSWGSAGPVSFIKFDAWGTLTNLNASGYLFHLADITNTANGLFDEISVTAAQVFDAALKIRVGSADYFIGLCDDNTFA